MRYFAFFLIVFLIIAILFRFVGVIFLLLFKFWYISLGLAVYFYIRSQRKAKIVKKDTISKLNPEDEIKLSKDAKVEDVEVEDVDIEDEK